MIKQSAVNEKLSNIRNCMKYFFIIPFIVNIPRHHQKSSDFFEYPKKSLSDFVTLHPAS